MRRRDLLILATLAGCSSPEATYYTLADVPGTPQPGGPPTVEVRRIGLAGYLDRNGIVRADLGVRLDVAQNDVWGAPLGDMMTRTLAEDLTQRLPGSAVFPDTGAISAEADTQVEVDVQRFNAIAGGEVELLAQVAIARHGSREPIVSRAERITEHPAGASTGDLVAALSRALGQLADRIATDLTAVPTPAHRRRGRG